MRARRQRDSSGRFLTAILFVDIVGSTELASRIGDAAWQVLLGRYYAAVRDRLRRFDGRQIDTAGDGLFAAFDAPADAIACALSIRDAAEGLGIATRAGIHMGEVQTIEGKVGGIAVHIGARIASAAGSGEVLVSSTVKDLVEGSGLRFEDRGETALKGVPGQWRLFMALPPTAPDGSVTGHEAPATARGRGRRESGAGGAIGRLLPTSLWARGLIVGVVLVLLVAIVGSGLLSSGGVTASATPFLAGAAGSSPTAESSVSPAPSPSTAASSAATATQSPQPSVGVAPSPSAPSSAPPAPSPSVAPPIAVDANSLGRLDPTTGSVVADLDVGAQPSGIAVGADGSIWVTNTTAGTVSRLDPTGTRVVQTIQGVGTSPTGIAVGPDAIWVADSGSREVARISPATNQVVKEYPVGNAPSGVAVDASGQVWITNRLDGTVVDLDPDSGKLKPYTIGLTPMDVAAGAASVWVADYDKGAVVRVDPGGGGVLARVNVGNGPSALAASDGAVWVANRLDGTVSHIDPATNSVVGTVSVGGEPTGVAIGPDAIWVAVASTSQLVKIEPQGNAVDGQFPLGASPQAVAMAGAQPLFTAWTAPGNHMGGTLKILATPENWPTSPDPTWVTSQLISVTNDALVSYRQVGGPDGVQLVADLATSIPTASPDGRTYVFHVRTGITFSNGAPLRASDVLWSAEREEFANKPFGGVLTPDVVSQKALKHCKATDCDLSKQIVVNDATGTVTFHLITSDPFFLYNLTGIAVVPEGTPFAQSPTPVPGTGPYMLTQFDSTGAVLKRNPSFHVWSSEAQPQGYPDEIDWQEVSDESSALQAVEAGQADWLAGALTIDQVNQLEVIHPDQLSISPSTRVWTEVMNTKMAPFSSRKVRQAINDVVDRQAMADAYGGGVVTCQFVPPTFAGYLPYCPYTSEPDSSQTWRGPAESIAEAVSVIKQAGMYGKPVTIWTSPDRPFVNVQNYVAGLLTKLGFKVTQRHLDDADLFGGEDPHSPLNAQGANTAQMAGFWFYSPLPTAATSFPGVFTCPGAYPEQFCDPAIDSIVNEALKDEESDDPALRAAANVLWARVDKAVVDAAPAVFAFNPWDVNFFSSRVGHFQHQPVVNVLFDQLWVQ